MITGLPGSGKSTLMKCLTQSQQVKHNLEQWAEDSNRTLIHAHFFFSTIHGSQILTSEDAMRRDILLQVLQQQPDLAYSLFDKEVYIRDDIELPQEIPKVALQRFFDGVKGIKERFCLCLFIDGLDEFRESASSMAQDNGAILRLIKELAWQRGGGTPMKLVFSCRPMPNLSPKELSIQFLVLDRYTKQDILHSLLYDRVTQQLRGKEDTYTNLCQLIADKANGVFIWAHFVGETLLSGDSTMPIDINPKDWIEEASKDLNKLYAQTLERIDEAKQKLAATLFYLAAFKPLSFRLNTLVCRWLEELTRPGSGFPMNQPVPARDSGYRSDLEVLNMVSLASRRAGSLTHGILVTSDGPYLSHKRCGVSKSTLQFFSSEIVFYHRSVGEYVKDLIQGKEGVVGPSWLSNQRERIRQSLLGEGNLVDPFARIFVAEMRFGVVRKDDEGNPHKDNLDFGFWGDDKGCVSERRLMSAGKADLGRISGIYKQFYVDFHGGQSSFIASLWEAGVDIEEWYSFGTLRMNLPWAMYKGVNVTEELSNRHIGPALGARLAMVAATERDERVMSWLLENKCVTPRTTVSILRHEAVRFVSKHLRDNFEKTRNHAIEDCICGDREEPIISENGIPVPIWLITLRLCGYYARMCRTSTSAEQKEKLLSGWAKLLKVWLSQSKPSDAIIIVAVDESALKSDSVSDKNLFYIEIDQLWEQFENAAGGNHTEMKKALTALRRPWWKEVPLSKWHSIFGRSSTGGKGREIQYEWEIRSRYRHLSDADLCQSDWAVYGVISRKYDLLGNFNCHLT